MIYLLLFFLLVFSFPYLLAPLLIVLALFISFKFTVNALIALIYAPAQLFKIATNKRLRQNHALEHATINVIEEVYGPQNLSGLARENGFFILGSVSPRLVEKAAYVALERLKGGAKDLVVHRRCGSSLVIANFVAAITFLLLLLFTGYFTLIHILIALLASNLLGPAIGRLGQIYFTTSSKVDALTIIGARPYAPSGLLGLVGSSNRIFIATEERG